MFNSIFNFFQNLAGFIGQILNQRLGMFGLFLPLYLELPRFCLVTFFFLAIHPILIGNVATAMLLLNRLTAIALPIKYEKVSIYCTIYYRKLILPFIFN